MGHFNFSVVLSGTWLSLTPAVALFIDSLAGVGGKGEEKQLFISYLCRQSASFQLLFVTAFYNVKAWSLSCLSSAFLSVLELGRIFFFLFQFLFTLPILDKWAFAPLPALWDSTPEDRQQQLNNMAVCINNLHSVQHPNFLRDYCFYFHRRPVIKDG